MKRILLSIVLLVLCLNVKGQQIVANEKLLEAVDLNVVSCVGYPESGQVAITLTLTPRNFMLNANIAGGWEGRAYDASGKQYRTRRVYPGGTLHKSDIPQGIPFTFLFGIEGVDAKTPMLKSVTLPYHVNAGNYNFLIHSGNNAPIEIRDLPIAWQKPSGKSHIRVPFELMGNVELNVVSCIGDKASGLVTVEFTTMCNIGGDTRMSLCDSREDKAFDNAGNAYEVKTKRMETLVAPQNTPLKYTVTFTMPADTKEVTVLRVDYAYSNNQSDWGCRQNQDRGMIEFHHIPIVWQ